MKTLVCIFSFFLVTLTTSSSVCADEETATLSPYFIVSSGEDELTERFPLLSSTADVKISGVIADVRITQWYKNDGAEPIEARYVFPGSTRSAIYGMQMTIGDRVRRAKIQEKKAAKRTYEAAKKSGKSASLLEQRRPNVFEMSVANILPGDEIMVELWYTELLVPESGIYEFVYPAVVGPRYSEIPQKVAHPEVTWIANPYQSEGESPSYQFDVAVELSTGIPIKDLTSSTHTVHVDYQEQSRAVISFADGMKASGDRDYVLRYRLRDNAIQSGLLLYEGEEESFFTLLVEPPKRVIPKQLPGREYVFVVDVSGSMNGFPLTISKNVIRALFDDLRPQDRFNVVLFAASSEVLSTASLAATRDNLDRAFQLIDSRTGGGGTRLLPALQTALALPTSEDISRSFIILTDGYIAADIEVLEHIGQNLQNANYFAFGLGSSVNRHLIEGIAAAGLGESFVALSPQEAHVKAAAFHQYVKAPILTNITVDWGEGADVYDLEPKFIPDLLAERPLVIKGKYRTAPPHSVTLRGSTGAGLYIKTLELEDEAKEHSALKYLWARTKVARLGDYHKLTHAPNLKEQITELGLRYELLTQFTSFVAVDEIVRNSESGPLKSVKQPLPLPKGVSNSAIGSSVPSTPEPAEWMLILLIGCVILFAVRHEKGIAWR